MEGTDDLPRKQPTHSGSDDSFASAASDLGGDDVPSNVGNRGMRPSYSDACCDIKASSTSLQKQSTNRARSPSSSGKVPISSTDGNDSDGILEEVVIYRTFDFKEPVYEGARSILPALMVQRNEVSIWSILKHAIGKDLTRITMPIVFNEPLTFLQRLAEHMEYIELVKKAAICDDPIRRIELIAAFAVSALAANKNRVAKPFNPLLGETYELDRMNDLGFRYMAEQVCHHPPISAYHVSGDGFTYWGSCYAKIKFFGQTVDCKPTGTNTLLLDKYDETYTWNNPTCSVHNLVVGSMYIEHSGTVDVRCHKTGLTASINFKPAGGWFGGGAPGYIVGTVLDQKKKRVHCLYGDWSEFLAASSPENFDKNFAAWGKEHREHKAKTNQRGGGGGAAGGGASGSSGRGHSPPPNRRFSTIGLEHDEDGTELMSGGHGTRLAVGGPGPPGGNRQAIGTGAKSPAASAQLMLPLLVGSEVLWRASARSAVADDYYHFTNFALLLNEPPDDNDNLAPTDSRFRPDVRFMDQGDIESASSEKHRLEEKQRAAATERKRERQEWQPRWFAEGKHDLLKGEIAWKFNAKYWDRQWNGCPDIF